MKESKKVFWISFFAMIACICMIIIFAPLNSCYHKEVFAVFENIFISLIGGTWLSMITAIVSFYNSKRRNVIAFNSEFTNLYNKIVNLHRWYNIKYERVKYYSCSELEGILSEEKIKKFIKKNDKHNDNIVHQFYKKIKAIEEYNFDRIYECMDDFCSLKIKGESEIKEKMKEIVELINKYNVIYLKSVHFCGYESGIYDEYILYKTLCPQFEKIIKDYPVKQFHIKKKEFLDLTKINKSLEKDYKSKKIKKIDGSKINEI